MHLQYKPDASTKVQVEENLYSVAKTVWGEPPGLSGQQRPTATVFPSTESI
jgi:hypothetical protein